jgi:signal transduction histidine kinase
VSAGIELRDGRLVCRIRDDGKGMPTELVSAGARQRGIGLASLQARAAQVGGRLTVESFGDAGTQLTFSMPVKRR